MVAVGRMSEGATDKCLDVVVLLGMVPKEQDENGLFVLIVLVVGEKAHPVGLCHNSKVVVQARQSRADDFMVERWQ